MRGCYYRERGVRGGGLTRCFVSFLIRKYEENVKGDTMRMDGGQAVGSNTLGTGFQPYECPT